jgi:hypothetical protein
MPRSGGKPCTRGTFLGHQLCKCNQMDTCHTQIDRPFSRCNRLGTPRPARFPRHSSAAWGKYRPLLTIQLWVQLQRTSWSSSNRLSNILYCRSPSTMILEGSTHTLILELRVSMWFQGMRWQLCHQHHMSIQLDIYRLSHFQLRKSQ